MFKGFFKTKTIIVSKIKEAFSCIVPITLIILLVSQFITPIEIGTFVLFLAGSFLLTIGMGVFTLGADTAMTPIGEYIGTNVIKSRKLWIILPVFFIVGILITVSEPDLQVLAGQLSGTVNPWVLMFAVGIGVGLFLVIAVLRILFKFKLSVILLLCYGAVFILSFFVPSNFVPLAFDSGGVTTGPMSVPFIIAIGTGIVSLRTDHGAESDGFGLTALCSVGPIIAVMILGAIYHPENVAVSPNVPELVINSKDVVTAFTQRLPDYMKEVGIAVLPIAALFFITLVCSKKMERGDVIKIIVGIIYTYVGLVLFLVGVNVGFLPVGAYLGKALALLEHKWVIVPIGMVTGFFIVAAEPAVHILNNRVYEITAGAIPKKAMSFSLMIGVAISVGLAFTRILLDIPIMFFLVPAYLIALVLMFIVPEMFTAIAFDSGGVASGAMATGFLLPFSFGICEALGRPVGTGGFGVVAFVAMTPLITIQILGLIYKVKKASAEKKKIKAEKDEIIID